MVRVISGTAGGLKLQTPDEDITRPTLDRVKEAMFSIVQNDIYGSSVLDLFAGSGALGIEALSRGADRCVFNDRSRKCADIIRGNLAHTRLDSRAEILVSDHTEALSVCRSREMSFGLVLLDPPYGKGFETDALMLISRFGLALPRCVAAVEHSALDTLPDTVGTFGRVKTKKYGTVCVSVYENEV